jgi:N-methylhydantoinase A
MGALPGPACYDKGGDEATVTDADVMLGYVDPDFYLGGDIRLNAGRAAEVVTRVAKAIGHTPIETADGIFHIVNANMINGIRVVSVEKGHDPRDFALLSFGGAGAVHATALIEEMGVDKVVIPQLASGFSAYGMLCTDLHRDYVTTINRRLADLDAEVINAAVAKMEQAGRTHFDNDGTLWCEYLADMRYKGQAHDIRVPLKVPLKDISRAIRSFNATYRKSYGYLLDEDAIQLINLRVSVYKGCSKPPVRAERANPSSSRRAVKGSRQAYFNEDGRFVRTPVYDAHKLQAGNRLTGPAIVELTTTTIVVRPDQTLLVDPYRNYVVARRGVRL